MIPIPVFYTNSGNPTVVGTATILLTLIILSVALMLIGCIYSIIRGTDFRDNCIFEIGSLMFFSTFVVFVTIAIYITVGVWLQS